MDIQQLKAQGMPVLEAQLQLHKIALKKVYKIIQSNKSLRITCLVTEPGLPLSDVTPLSEVTFLFIEEELIPVEFITAFEQYSNRLIAESWILEAAIDELKTEESLLSLFRNNARA